MPMRITRMSKTPLVVGTPVMNAAGVLGFSDAYKGLIDLGSLGAFITNPITYSARSAANGTRMIPLTAGVLMHTGLPNPGVRTLIREHQSAWERMNIPIIAHIAVTTPDDLRACVRDLEQIDAIAAFEVGFHDQITPAEMEWFLRAARGKAEKPILARLPFLLTPQHIEAATDGGADALVLTAPPRGTARSHDGKLISGRLYSPIVKPQVLWLVGQIARHSKIPIIAAGGIHSTDDARDYIAAGAVAVQIDAALWSEPSLIHRVAGDLGGVESTQTYDVPDEWRGVDTSL